MLRLPARLRMMPDKKFHLLTIFALGCLTTVAQPGENVVSCPKPATIVVFRTFNFFSFKFSYKLFANDSLLGRMKEHSVIVFETYDHNMNFHATVKAPSVNAGRRGNYQKIKKINYPFTLKQGQIYFVKCGFLNRNLFEYPRQPTIRLLKGNEIFKYMRKGFVRRKLKSYLYQKWLMNNSPTSA
jgi:hypothetical protein